MSRTRTAAAVSAAALLGVALLAGCSSASEPAASESAAASDSSTQMLPPVIITEDQDTAAAKVGDFLDIIVPENQLVGTTVATDQPELVELTQAREEGGAMFNPGGKALAPGTAVIVVTDPSGAVRDITLTITE